MRRLTFDETGIVAARHYRVTMSIFSATFAELPLLIRSRGFLRVWLSQVLSQIATNLLHFALILRTFEITGSSFFVGVFVAVVSLPSILFAALGGVFADRYDRRAILFIVNGARVALSVTLLPFLDVTGIIFVVVFFLTTLTEFFLPAEAALIPTLVPPDRLTGANALFALTLYTSFLFGYSAAGPILHFGGPMATLLVVAGLYAAAAFSILGVPSSHHPPAPQHDAVASGAQGMRAKLMEGIHFIRSHRLLPTLILEVSVLFGIERGVIALIPAVALGFLGFTSLTVSVYLILPLALGTILGVLLVNRLKRTIHPLSLVHAGIIFESISLLLIVPVYIWLLRLLPELPVVVLRGICAVTAAFIAGLGNVLVVVSTQTIIQRETDDEKRGRVFGGLLTVMNCIGLPLIFLLSHLGTVMSPVKLFIALGAVLCAVAGVSMTMIKMYWRRQPYSVRTQ